MTLPTPPSVGDPITAAMLSQLIAAGAVTASGSVSITPTGANVTTTAAVTFPAGRFGSAPMVFTQLLTGVTASTGCITRPSGITSSGFTMNINRGDTTASSIGWLAIVTP